jgi:membrane associated rhomboid family serine protease
MIPASVGFQCPECVADGRRTQRKALTHFGGSQVGMHGYVTKALMGINLAVFVLGIVLVGAKSAFDGGLFTGSSVIQWFGAVTGPSFCTAPEGVTFCVDYFTGIDDGAYYRLFTAMFIHYGLVHVALNMVALWMLGRALEAALGPVRFAALYLLAGFGGNVACYLLQPDSLSAGASTAIYGLFAAYFIVLRRLGRDTSGIIALIVINVVLSFSIPGVSVVGHLGGLVTGALAAVGLAYAPRGYRTQVQVATLVGLFLVLLVVSLGTMLVR